MHGLGGGGSRGVVPPRAREGERERARERERKQERERERARGVAPVMGALLAGGVPAGEAPDLWKGQILYEKTFNVRLSGNAVYYTA